ncbi:diaminopimelate decarboxylase [Candidatus Kirkpatrickella diaphorinae]|uniref:Diaminopimelate decarboxylase n=1 Tax=Candidatus Kirkpatrickella diaphorinae TaxID=2984322 RepID=A0ABY6GKV9_9PROT|nr:diaminopimelate decarboxylase [Candidatus Kirkpatrickella diaphorinae]UYH52095.1 diaminopimelate decarboxylase [Candidatus Kirkpatrickella diaphorinae]
MSNLPPSLVEILQSRPWLRYDTDAALIFDGVRLQDIAAQYDTPCWVFSASILRARARALKAAFSGINQPISMHYAVKANDHRATLAILQREGFGADVVSGGELRKAIAAGIVPFDIVFSGVGKKDAELTLAIETEIGVINVESREELGRLTSLATRLGKRPKVALRVNPHIDAGTHDKISTGREGDKFGIDWREAPTLSRMAARDPHLDFIGLAAHIGSQITSIAPFEAACQRLAGMITDLRADGIAVKHVDCGGGLGICYHQEAPPDITEYARVIANHLGTLNVAISIEPGRWLSGPTGILLTRVIDVKAQPAPRSDFVFIDAAMNDLARPALYAAWHEVLPLHAGGSRKPEKAQTLAGPVCETGDILATDRVLPPLSRDDLLAILDAGAYGAVMSSTYNARPLAAQIMIEDGKIAEIRQRQTLESLWEAERLPDWFKAE